MKHAKHLASLLLALAMTLALTVSALAAPSDTCTIYFNDPFSISLLDGEATPVATKTLAGYQLLSLTYSLKSDCGHAEGGAHTDACYNFAYSFDTNGTGGASKYRDILLTAAGLTDKISSSDKVALSALLGELEKMANDSVELNKFAKAVYEAIQTAELAPDKKDLSASGELNVGQGYWLFADVTEYGEDAENTVRSLVLLDTKGEPELTVKPKQNIPSVEKKVSDKANATDLEYDDSTTAKIGDTVYFKITGTLPGYLDYYTSYKYSFHDALSKGLTIDEESIEVKIDGTDVTDSFTTKTVSTDSATGKTTITVGCPDIKSISGVTSGSEVVLTYSAVVNKDAVVGSEGNPNKVHLDYSNNPYDEGEEGKTPDDEVEVYTYKFDLVKTKNDDTILSGAEFKLYDAETGGNEIALVEESDGVYRVATPEEKAADDFVSAVIKAGKVTIKGLKNGDYWLEETKAPEGYNILLERQKVTIKDADLDATVDTDKWTAGGVQVINNAGTELPSTGGIGTTIFYVLGSALVLGAVVLLVTRRRMRDRT